MRKFLEEWHNEKNSLKDQFSDKGAREGHGECFRISIWRSRNLSKREAVD